jgi:hypothetical protein
MSISPTTMRRMRLAAAGIGVAAGIGAVAAASGAQPAPTTTADPTGLPSTTVVVPTTALDPAPETVPPVTDLAEPPLLPPKVLPFDGDDCPGCGLG